MNLTDSVELSGTRRTADGYLVADARVARTGVQLYRGAEVGRPEMDVVRIWRPEAEVFDAGVLQTFAYRPVTIGHPAGGVTADNWREVAVGQTGGEVVRDGAFVRVPLVLMDKAAIAAVEAGQRELSMGYAAEIEFADGSTPEGEPYDAIQRGLRMNHVAVVAKARGGSELRIGDGAGKGGAAPFTTERPMTDALKTVVLGDKAVHVAADAAPIIEAYKAQMADALAEKDAASAEARKLADTRDGEIAALKAQLADAQMTPEKLAEAVRARSALLADAAKLAPALTGLDTKPEAEIRRAVVAARLGDAAAAMSDEAVAGAFTTLAATTTDKVRDALKSGTQQKLGDADEAYAANVAALTGAWKKEA